MTPTTQAGATSAEDTVERISLADCPIGLFLASSGTLCLKTEYGDNEGRIDAYIVESGEFFWGGANSIGEQRRVMVTPVPLEQIADAIRLPSASRSPSPAVVPEVVRRLPRLTDAMIRAACKAHYGDDNIDGVDLTSHDINYSFRQGFQRMWRGIRKALADAPPSGRAAEESFRCPNCGCRTCARIDERKPDGRYGPGPDLRCVECKCVVSAPTPPASAGDVDGDLTALAEAASVAERAYGILWRLTAFDSAQYGYAHDARKVLFAAMDKEGQRRGIAWATRQYGPLGPNPRFMLSDEDRMEMGL